VFNATPDIVQVISEVILTDTEKNKDHRKNIYNQVLLNIYKQRDMRNKRITQP